MRELTPSEKKRQKNAKMQVKISSFLEKLTMDEIFYLAKRLADFMWKVGRESERFIDTTQALSNRLEKQYNDLVRLNQISVTKFSALAENLKAIEAGRESLINQLSSMKESNDDKEKVLHEKTEVKNGDLD